jgi:muramoyltetrapeptide carboxypeptidase
MPPLASVVPPPLAPGARVALVAPAGPVSAEDVARAEAHARSFGWEPRVGAHALAHTDYFAGPDAERLADLNAALADPAVDGVWCLRGGYGRCGCSTPWTTPPSRAARGRWSATRT